MPESVIIRHPARPAAAVEADLNRLAADLTRERQRPGPLPELAPIPASVGVADWGGAQERGT